MYINNRENMYLHVHKYTNNSNNTYQKYLNTRRDRDNRYTGNGGYNRDNDEVINIDRLNTVKKHVCSDESYVNRNGRAAIFAKMGQKNSKIQENTIYDMNNNISTNRYKNLSYNNAGETKGTTQNLNNIRIREEDENCSGGGGGNFSGGNRTVGNLTNDNLTSGNLTGGNFNRGNFNRGDYAREANAQHYNGFTDFRSYHNANPNDAPYNYARFGRENAPFSIPTNIGGGAVGIGGGRNFPFASSKHSGRNRGEQYHSNGDKMGTMQNGIRDNVNMKMMHNNINENVDRFQDLTINPIAGHGPNALGSNLSGNLGGNNYWGDDLWGNPRQRPAGIDAIIKKYTDRDDQEDNFRHGYGNNEIEEEFYKNGNNNTNSNHVNNCFGSDNRIVNKNMDGKNQKDVMLYPDILSFRHKEKEDEEEEKKREKKINLLKNIIVTNPSKKYNFSFNDDFYDSIPYEHYNFQTSSIGDYNIGNIHTPLLKKNCKIKKETNGNLCNDYNFTDNINETPNILNKHLFKYNTLLNEENYDNDRFDSVNRNEDNINKDFFNTSVEKHTKMFNFDNNTQQNVGRYNDFGVFNEGDFLNGGFPGRGIHENPIGRQNFFQDNRYTDVRSYVAPRNPYEGVVPNCKDRQLDGQFGGNLDKIDEQDKWNRSNAWEKPNEFAHLGKMGGTTQPSGGQEDIFKNIEVTDPPIGNKRNYVNRELNKICGNKWGDNTHMNIFKTEKRKYGDEETAKFPSMLNDLPDGYKPFDIQNYDGVKQVNIRAYDYVTNADTKGDLLCDPLEGKNIFSQEKQGRHHFDINVRGSIHPQDYTTGAHNYSSVGISPGNYTDVENVKRKNDLIRDDTFIRNYGNKNHSYNKYSDDHPGCLRNDRNDHHFENDNDNDNLYNREHYRNEYEKNWKEDKLGTVFFNKKEGLFNSKIGAPHFKNSATFNLFDNNSVIKKKKNERHIGSLYNALSRDGDPVGVGVTNTMRGEQPFAGKGDGVFGGVRGVGKENDLFGGMHAPGKGNNVFGGVHAAGKDNDLFGGMHAPGRGNDVFGGVHVAGKDNDLFGGMQAPDKSNDVLGGMHYASKGNDVWGKVTHWNNHGMGSNTKGEDTVFRREDITRTIKFNHPYGEPKNFPNGSYIHRNNEVEHLSEKLFRKSNPQWKHEAGKGDTFERKDKNLLYPPNLGIFTSNHKMESDIAEAKHTRGNMLNVKSPFGSTSEDKNKHSNLLNSVGKYNAKESSFNYNFADKKLYNQGSTCNFNVIKQLPPLPFKSGIKLNNVENTNNTRLKFFENTSRPSRVSALDASLSKEGGTLGGRDSVSAVGGAVGRGIPTSNGHHGNNSTAYSLAKHGNTQYVPEGPCSSLKRNSDDRNLLQKDIFSRKNEQKEGAEISDYQFGNYPEQPYISIQNNKKTTFMYGNTVSKYNNGDATNQHASANHMKGDFLFENEETMVNANHGNFNSTFTQRGGRTDGGYTRRDDRHIGAFGAHYRDGDYGSLYTDVKHAKIYSDGKRTNPYANRDRDPDRGISLSNNISMILERISDNSEKKNETDNIQANYHNPCINRNRENSSLCVNTVNYNDNLSVDTNNFVIADNYMCHFGLSTLYRCKLKHEKYSFLISIVDSFYLNNANGNDIIANNILFHKRLRHINILAYKGKTADKTKLYLLFENINGNVLKSHSTPFEESIIASYAYQIVDLLEYMHANFVIFHGLLSSVLILQKNTREELVQILNERKKNVNKYFDVYKHGIIKVFNFDFSNIDASEKDYEFDFICLAVLIYEMCTRYNTYYSTKFEDIAERIHSTSFFFPHFVSLELKNFCYEVMHEKGDAIASMLEKKAIIY
ncbi:protein kinase [Plasmodium ovale curtisi]|uniref:non-specific serine/threonine protein kinase n=1 Tax=Plasmodium ovale curtisi TaxID=864141 RepID=A0A1A8VLE4_PLAOA|nr:protein kinase [Plasmodium ovale curtisi]SBS81120.1 protein kinase [Plasmodium ovale curtisi]